jgi:hypothetical protein
MWSLSLWKKGSGHEFVTYNSEEEAHEAYDKVGATRAKLLGMGRKIQRSSGCSKWMVVVKQYWEVALELVELGKSIEEYTLQKTNRWSVAYHWGRTGHHFATYDSESDAKNAYKKVPFGATKVLNFGREVIESFAPFCLFYLWQLSVQQYSQICLSVMEHQDALAGSLSHSHSSELKHVDWLAECGSPASPSSLVSSVESDTILGDSVLGDSIPLVFYY